MTIQDAVLTEASKRISHNGTGHEHHANQALLHPLDQFVHRHLGRCAADVAQMLEAVGAASVEALIDETIPSAIRMQGTLKLAESRANLMY